MSLLLDSLWRSLAYCLHPRVIALSFLPLLLAVGVSTALFWFFWDPAVQSVQAWLAQRAFLEGLQQWLQSVAPGPLQGLLAPLLVLLLALPLLVALCLLTVAWLVTPAIVALVSARRFADLQQRRGGSLVGSVALSLGSVLLALVALVLSMPLWLIPPLVLVLPPLIWGWLTSRVMVYDALALHASAEERRELARRHGLWLLVIGIVAGYMGAAPAMVWTIGAMAIVLAPVVLAVAIWIYTFVFIFASLWFVHYTLAALAALRVQREAGTAVSSAAQEPPSLAGDPSIPSLPHG